MHAIFNRTLRAHVQEASVAEMPVSEFSQESGK